MKLPIAVGNLAIESAVSFFNIYIYIYAFKDAIFIQNWMLAWYLMVSTS